MMRPARRRTATLLAIAATTAAGAAALSATGVAAGAGATSAPVMHEKFTPLPCPHNPTTTLQLEGCAEQRILAQDKTIDALNAKIFARLSSARPRREFVAGHTAWLTYRQRFCTAEADSLSTGTLNPVDFGQCEVQLGGDRIAELRSYLTAVRGD